MLTKKDLEHLGELARLDLSNAEEEKLLNDLQKIFNHFEELTNAKTESVEPIIGGAFLENAYRSDENRETALSKEKSVEQFPEKDRGCLKIPPVFE